MSNVMSNKEAIKNIKELLKWYLKEEPMSETVYKREAIEMAIQSLEQQPSEDVLDKIKVEITEEFGNCSICEWFEDYDYDENDISEYRSVGHISDIIDIIDKYRKEI